MAEAFRQDVVKSVALSCLLAMDYVPGSKPPPIAEMVSHELPRVLSTVQKVQPLGPVEHELTAPTADPVGLLQRVVEKITDFGRARDVVIDHGHEDMVFSALRYTRKPPTATCNRIRRTARQVAKVLCVDIPDDFDERIGEMYDVAHGMLVKV
jgi:hypothetical protein